MKVIKAGEARDNAPCPRAYDREREAAIERAVTPYIPLACGHKTTWEIDELYSAWRPKKTGKKHPFYCETCGKWVLRVLLHKPRPVRENGVPLF